MKRQLAAISLAMFGLMAFQAAAQADTWFDRHDYNHDGHWNYHEFRAAHMEWARQHSGERRWKERELHDKFNEMSHDHPGYVRMEEVRGFHSW